MLALSIFEHIYIEPFTPPLPMFFCLIGAALVVVASFILVTFFANKPQIQTEYSGLSLSHLRIAQLVTSSPVTFTLQVASVALFLLVILAGFLGNQDPIYNFAPTFIWVIWWVGFAYVSAFLGNIWHLVNPWSILYDWFAKLLLLLGFNKRRFLNIHYPIKLNAWPALLIFFIYGWTENIYHDAVIPVRIGQMILIYSLITFAGMICFGKNTWLRYGEAFTVAFGLLAKFAPIEVIRKDPLIVKESPSYLYNVQEQKNKNDASIFIRYWGLGLINLETVSVAQMTFVILLLAIVTFDGFMGTMLWSEIQITAFEYISSVMLIGTAGLLLTVVVFVVLYLGFSKLMKIVSRVELSTIDLARLFVHSLIPIALAYHVAHFLLFLLIQGQLIIPLLSDPFGLGWNLLGSADYRVNFKIVGPNFYWSMSVVSIVIGHIIAVFVAHTIALKLLKDKTIALRTQYPMLVLMVIYTVASLWIITQPMYMSSM